MVKLEKQSWLKASKQQKILFAMDIKTKPHDTKNIWKWFGSHSQDQNYF